MGKKMKRKNEMREPFFETQLPQEKTISRRDIFAAAALTGLLPLSGSYLLSHEEMKAHAERVFQLADAMMKAGDE